MKKHTVIYDIETTGLSPQHDWIVQLSALKFDKETFEVVGKWNHYINPSGNWEMTPAAQEVHGLSKEFIEKNGKSLKVVGPSFLDFIDGCDLMTFNGNSFDVVFAYKDFAFNGLNFPIADIMHYDVRLIELKLHPNNLGAVFERYTGKTMEQAGLNAHDSMSDVMATFEVFKHQMEYLDYETIDEWDENKVFTPDRTVRNAGDGREYIVFNQGKYKDMDVYEVMKKDPGYLKWAADKMFSSYTLKIVREYCKKMMAAEGKPKKK